MFVLQTLFHQIRNIHFRCFHYWAALSIQDYGQVRRFLYNSKVLPNHFQMICFVLSRSFFNRSEKSWLLLIWVHVLQKENRTTDCFILNITMIVLFLEFGIMFSSFSLCLSHYQYNFSIFTKLWELQGERSIKSCKKAAIWKWPSKFPYFFSSRMKILYSTVAGEKTLWGFFSLNLAYVFGSQLKLTATFPQYIENIFLSKHYSR